MTPDFIDPQEAMVIALAISRTDRKRMHRELARCGVTAPIDWPAIRASGALPPEWAEMAIRCFARGRDGFTQVEFEAGRTLTFPIGRRELVEKILAGLPCRSSVARLDLDDDARRATVVLKVAISEEEPVSGSRLRGSQWATRRMRFFTANEPKLPFLIKSLAGSDLAEPVRVTYLLSDERAAWLSSSPDAYVTRALDDSRYLAGCLSEFEFNIRLIPSGDLAMAGTQARNILFHVARGRASIEEALLSVASLVLHKQSVFARHSPTLREQFAEAIRWFRASETPARLHEDELERLSSLDSRTENHLPVALEMSDRYDLVSRRLMDVWHAEEHSILCGLHELANALDSKYPSSGKYTLHHGKVSLAGDASEGGDNQQLDSWEPPLL